MLNQSKKDFFGRVSMYIYKVMINLNLHSEGTIFSLYHYQLLVFVKG